MWVLYQDGKNGKLDNFFWRPQPLSSICILKVKKDRAAEAGQRRQTWSEGALLQGGISSKTGLLAKACSQPAHGIYPFSLRLSKSEMGSEFSGIQPGHSGIAFFCST